MGMIQNAINQILGMSAVGIKLASKGMEPKPEKTKSKNISYEQKIKNMVAANQKAEKEFINRQEQKENFKKVKEGISHLGGNYNG